jgi:type II protein arginine methyltransferase
VIAGERGDLDHSKDYFFMTVEALAPNFDILCLTGDLARYFGFLEITVKAFDRAMEIVPHASHALLRRGQTFSEAGDCNRRPSKGYPAATEPVCRPRRSRRRISVANMTDAACKCYHTALDIGPQNTSARSGLDHTLALVLPQWHNAMLNDTNRNDAFAEAIKAAVTTSSTILDIGTGTGLLAMMANRAEAAKVTGCESVGILAQTASEIVKQNGF